jgi:transcriptional regulator with XRE-family HTH domain
VPDSRPPFEQRVHRRAFGDRVSKLRRDRGWTQEQLAERADLHRSYVAGLESGARNPTLDVIVRLADALQVAPSGLFDQEES